jgi:anti-sigma factor RsiW
MKKPDPSDLKPCPHMRTWVSAWIDGRLTGLARWYTERHVHGCPQCQSSLPFLRGMRARLLRFAAPPPDAALPPERWAQVEAEWERAERDLAPPSRPL